ncbi:GDSL esterase/lipase At5g42170 [Selaginella moellendorffii]|uniref:GDSL esterase/lipase At5g42170 n=1 Tax=Selaginella moellendorffii TaxID=88036 RepID=UPI000D1C6812|nr:GDSL esterase/lipase At5g42170 [Selaginella moellendorffii]|eukprot:XP_002963333.2 GDSL esterase/lipase At5g42170 [Selaginella moellendorffii]
MDVGINNYLNATPTSHCNNPPYGRIFDTGKPSGRFSDGELISDIIAKMLGLPFPLPYLDPTANGDNLKFGISFASGGSGLLNSTSELQNVAKVNLQISWFREYKDKLKIVLGTEQKATQFLNDALYFIGEGSNDYAFKSLNLAESLTSIEEFRNKLISNYKTYIEDIYSIGGRKFVIYGLTPIGCSPGLITVHNPLTRNCVDFLNNQAQEFNAYLVQLLNNITKELPGSQFIYLDKYAIFMDIIQNKFKYGFQVINRGCCGTGLIEFGQLCNPLVGACDDGSLYVYFDAAHGSLATYNITATKLRAQLESEFGVMF